MKIKLLTLLLVVAGIIMISGCVDSEKQPLTSKVQSSLYKNIFYPYAGFPDHSRPQMPDVPSPDSFPLQPGSLDDATSMLDGNIQKADVTSMKLEAGIQRQKAEGKNVSKVEALLDKYKLLVQEAKKYRALADKAVAEENNSSVAGSNLEDSPSENLKREYLIESQNRMIQANGVLKEIFEELRHLMPGNEELNSTSHLKAAGYGMVNLMGNLTLNLHLEEGELAIPNRSQDAEVYIKGDYTFDEKNDMHGEVDLYHINSADVKISGSRKAVMLRGKNITLTADGEGYVTFLGNGTYSIEDTGGIKNEQWAQPFFGEGPNPGEQGPRGPGENKPDGPGEYGSDGPGEYGPDGKNHDTATSGK